MFFVYTVLSFSRKDRNICPLWVDKAVFYSHFELKLFTGQIQNLTLLHSEWPKLHIAIIVCNFSLSECNIGLSTETIGKQCLHKTIVCFKVNHASE